MPAGRPRKYFNKEEKDEAHRKASSKHYSMYRDIISAHRKVKRDMARASQEPLAVQGTSKAQAFGGKRTGNSAVADSRPQIRYALPLREFSPPQEPSQTITPWFDVEENIDASLREAERLSLVHARIAKLEQRLARLTQNRSVFGILSGVCSDFVARSSHDIVSALDAMLEPVEELTRIEDAAQKYSKLILEFSQADPNDIQRVAAMHKEAQALLVTLEELLSDAIMGPEAFINDFRNGNLKFQQPSEMTQTSRLE